MAKKKTNKDTLREEYELLSPDYLRLAENLKRDLHNLVKGAGIEPLAIDFRIKAFDSFCVKKERKRYEDPLNDIEDICGLRIVCVYPSDLDKLSGLIQKEFEVLEKIDKQDLLGPNEFGYRSHHYILKLKPSWEGAPGYRGLGDKKFELQVRTILMHAWADISHKLEYKEEEYVPAQFKRKLCQISALLEMADTAFDSLRSEKGVYRETLLSEEVKETGQFDLEQPLNIDSLQAFLDFYFADRLKDKERTVFLLNELIKNSISIKMLAEAVEMVKDKLLIIEHEVDIVLRNEKVRPWNQIGAVRTILELTNDDYWKNRTRYYSPLEGEDDIMKRWRSKISKI